MRDKWSFGGSGYGLLLIAVLFWGGSASLAKFLFTTRFDALIITQTRSSLSFLLIASFFVMRDRAVFKIDVRDAWKFVLAGMIGIAATNYAYYYTVQEATVATAILVQYTAPVLVMIWAVFVARDEILNGAKVIALLLSLAGCWLAVTGGDQGTLQLRGWSIVSGAASSLCFAFMLLMSKHLLRKYSAWTMLTYAFGVATIFWLFVNTPWEIASRGYTLGDWGIFLLFAVVSILIPHAAFTLGLRVLEASTVGIATTMEPVVAIVIAFLALGETLNGMQILGGLFVVSAVVLVQARMTRRAVRVERAGHAGE